ncbi:hypothetical protein GCM10027570_46250 [Streptomonospora sediminis]
MTAFAANPGTDRPTRRTFPVRALGDPDRSRANSADYYGAAATGGEIQDIVVGNVHTDAESLRDAIKQFEALGADELILGPGTDDLDEIARLADIVL